MMLIALLLHIFSFISTSPMDNAEQHVHEPWEAVNNYITSANKTGNLDSTLSYLDSAQAICIEHNFIELLARTQKARGDCFYNHFIYDNALAQYFLALRIFEKNADTQPETAELLNTIGNVYLVTHNLDEALRYFSRAKHIYTLLSDTDGIISSQLNSGAVYQKKGEPEKALQKYLSALKATDAPGYEAHKAILLGNIGSTYVGEGNIDSGIIYLHKAYDIKRAFSGINSQIHTLNDLSEAMYLSNNPEKAKKYAEQVIDLAKSTGNSNQLRYGYLNLSKSNTKLGEYREAYNNLLSYQHINDSLFNLEKDRQLKKLQVQYETEKKDQAITSLKKEKEIDQLTFRIYLISGSFIVLIIVFLYNQQRLKARKNKELLEKEKEVERMKANFFANITHEFRTPLTLILSPLESLFQSNTDGQQRTWIGLIKSNAQRLLHLINEILDLSKIESGQMQLHLQQIDLNTFLLEIINRFRPLAQSEGITIKNSGSPDTFMVECDPAKLETIVTNLVSNAIKYTSNSGLITVSVAQIPLTKEFSIKVSDTGSGIPENEVAHVFNRYYRAGANRNTSGTGIGLALTKQLVELHKGVIQVRSRIGDGTSFIITMPIQHSPVKKLQAEDTVEPGRSTTILPEVAASKPVSASTKKKPLILIIEDNDDMRAFLASVLSEAYQTIEAADGEAGIALAKNKIPEVIISDVMMPKASGYEVCQALKQNIKTSHIPIILLTAKTSVSSRLAGLEYEADFYLNKPFIPQELLLTIRNLLLSRKKMHQHYHQYIGMDASQLPLQSMEEKFLAKLVGIVEKNYSDANFSISQLGAEIGMSRSQLHRKLQALTNESASRFLRNYRLGRALELIKSNSGSISEVAYMTGFNSPSYFNKCFLERYSYTPTDAVQNL